MANWNANRSYDLTDEKETKEYLRDVEVEYSFGCYDQKEPDACHRLAEFQESVKKNFAAAGPIYKETCDKSKYPRSCLKYAQWLLSAEKGKGSPPTAEDTAASIEYYEKACELGLPNGCYNAAVMRLKAPETDAANDDKAYCLMGKACSMGNGDACFELHTAYLTANRRPKDLVKAYQYASAGCNLDHVPSCSNLSLMYRHGHGTDKNEILSKELRKKAIRLANQYSNPGPQVKVNS